MQHGGNMPGKGKKECACLVEEEQGGRGVRGGAGGLQGDVRSEPWQGPPCAGTCRRCEEVASASRGY